MKAALLLALILGACAPSFAAEAPAPQNRYAATIAPAESFEVNGMLVERHGQRGSPMILIPGLSGGSWAWQDTVRRFSAEHVVYVVTLAGFDGRAPMAGNPIDNARQSLRQLIVSRKLDKPVLVGHSLGGALSIAFAEQDSALIRGVVAIDGLPVMPRTESMPAAQRAAIGGAMKARMASSSAEQFALDQQQFMRGTGVVDMERADELAKLSARSDPGAVGEAAAALIAADFRPGLKDITVPVLLVAPYFEPDAVQRGLTREMAKDYYTSLMAGTPKLQVVSIAPSRHFVMFDQPDMLADTLRGFLKSL
ncbi:alpha/beta hydrolase [Massilia sp. R2A-15]|uniref:alpha/beta fold hydrolase n=1 Tax=Massilia sp. R2A-15 TaxID=3064278 RepID=UPI0027329F9A|nr:alpha/beta hydrolase [Massilia sp. R2A-15]WLI91231.1 alpha/beta hydrolase [Massilia sp. R2A-15]